MLSVYAALKRAILGREAGISGLEKLCQYEAWNFIGMKCAKYETCAIVQVSYFVHFMPLYISKKDQSYKKSFLQAVGHEVKL